MPVRNTETTFAESVGFQELEMEEGKSQTRHPATLTTKTTATEAQPTEIRIGD